jgi:hypothetical protein
MSTARKPSFLGVKMPLLFDGGAKVGNGVRVRVGWEGSRVGGGGKKVLRRKRRHGGSGSEGFGRRQGGGREGKFQQRGKARASAEQANDQEDRQDLFHEETFSGIRD